MLKLSKLSKGSKFLSLVQILEFQSEIGCNILINQFLKTGYGLQVYQAKMLFHLVGGLNCMASIFGAAVSDSFLSSFQTILFSYIPLIFGTSLITLFSVNGFLANYGQLPLWSYFLACLFITVGLGGIRPCLFTMIGDQFLPSEKKQMEDLFSINFILVSIAALPVIYFIPYIKDNISCFGDECYPLSYGICLVILILACLCFILGRSNYRIIPTQGQFLPYKIIQVLSTQKNYQLISSEIDIKFLNEVKQFGKVCLVAFYLSFHFLLEEQTLSEWMNQFELTDKHILGIYVPTEACSIINFILSIIFAPILTLFLFPYLERRNITISTENRLLIGYLLMIFAFVLSTLLEYYVQFYSTGVIKSQGVVTLCQDCLSSSWQIPQFCLAALSNILIFPSLGVFLYQNVSTQFKNTSSSLLFISIFLANIMIILLEYPLQYLPTSTSRQWLYIFISSLGWVACYWSINKYFFNINNDDENDDTRFSHDDNCYLYLGDVKDI